MSRFWAGFVAASLLWGGAAATLYFALGYGPREEVQVAAEVEPVAAEEAPVEAEAPARRRRRRRRRSRRRRARSTPTGEARSGDDLGEGELRSVDLGGSGGEQQLAPAQIEAAFDSAMGGIRRCLVLMPGDAEVRGRLTFGLRVAGSGRVTRVNLSGPRAATTGEAGACLRRTARQIRFESFDGPEMIVHYPLTLE